MHDVFRTTNTQSFTQFMTHGVFHTTHTHFLTQEIMQYLTEFVDELFDANVYAGHVQIQRKPKMQIQFVQRIYI